MTESKVSGEEAEKLTKQFFSLLIQQEFLLETSGELVSDSASQNSTAYIASKNASELLSNQVSNWLSQISDDFDVDLNYRPATGQKDIGHELEVGLSYQTLNDKLSINGSVDMKTKGEAENTNKIVGDIDVDYKLTKNGKVRMRAFNRSNESELENESQYTQGVGLFYREDFDTFQELIQRYAAFFNGERRKKKRQEESKMEELSIQN